MSLVEHFERYPISSLWPISKAQTQAELGNATSATTKTTNTQTKLVKLLVAEYGGKDVKSDQIATGNTTGFARDAIRILAGSLIGGKDLEPK